MTTKKQQLADNPVDYVSNYHLMQCFYSESLKKFCLMFNAKLFTYKTWGGFVNKRNELIEKYNLQQSENA